MAHDDESQDRSGYERPQNEHRQGANDVVDRTVGIAPIPWTVAAPRANGSNVKRQL
jgi:hypothetical protein